RLFARLPPGASMRRFLLPAVAAATLAGCDLNDFRRTPIVSAGDFAPELHVHNDDMTRTPNGLRDQDLTVGTGEEAQSGQFVTVHYSGWLTSGTPFDSSLDREPFTFPLGRGSVIEGWDQGVAGMRVGGKRKLVIPPELGYGDRANGPIPAN